MNLSSLPDPLSSRSHLSQYPYGGMRVWERKMPFPSLSIKPREDSKLGDSFSKRGRQEQKKKQEEEEEKGGEEQTLRQP